MYTEEDLDAVRHVLANGERSSQFADRSTTYRSLDELLRLEQRIAGSLAKRRRPKQTFAVASKGFG